MQDGREKHEFAVDFRAFLLSEEFGEPVRAHDVVEEHVAGDAARKLLGLLSDGAVRRFDVGDHENVRS